MSNCFINNKTIQVNSFNNEQTKKKKERKK